MRLSVEFCFSGASDMSQMIVSVSYMLSCFLFFVHGNIKGKISNG